MFLPLLLVCSDYTEKEFLDFTMQAKEAWLDINDEEQFIKKIEDFIKETAYFTPKKNPNQPESEFISITLNWPCDLPTAIAFGKDPESSKPSKDNPRYMGHTIYIKQSWITKQGNIIGSSYYNYIKKIIVIRNHWIINKIDLQEEKSKNIYTLEKTLWLDCYNVLKNDFLKHNFLSFIWDVKKSIDINDAHALPIIVLNEKNKEGLCNDTEYHIYFAPSVIATFLFHELLKRVHATNNKPIKEPEPENKAVHGKNTNLNNNPHDQKDLKQQSSINNQKNDTKNKPHYIYYAASGAIIVGILIWVLFRIYKKV